VRAVTTLSAPPEVLPRRAVEVYDFRRPTTLAREHSRVLEVAFETFARQWGTQLTANTRTRCLVAFRQVVMLSYNEYAASLPAATTMVLCTTGAEEARSVLQFPAVAAMAWISHMLGGNGNHGEEERHLTPMEQTLVRKLVDDVLDDLRYSLGSLLTKDIAFSSIHHNSQFAQAAAPTDLMIVASFTVTSGEQSALATLAVPAQILLSHLAEPNPVVASVNVRDQVRAQLARVPVDVSLRLPAVPVTPTAVLQMAVGDVIPLNFFHTNPLDVAVNGQKYARAAVGANGSRMACVVTDIQENEQ
jgi:flagellar motor switch protein FliM